MTLDDDIRALLRAGVKSHEFKQALRRVEDEEQLTEYSAALPAMPILGLADWAKLKKTLTTRGGPTNKYEMLVRLHNALDADDQVAFWPALFGLVKAVWSEHPGWRPDTSGPKLPPS